MTTPNASPLPATHVAYLKGSPEHRFEMRSETFDDVMKALFAAHPGKTISDVKIDALPTAPPEHPVVTEAVIREIVTNGAPDPQAPDSERMIAALSAPLGFSSFSGPLVTDEAAKVRIEARHAALTASGVRVDASEQLFATGTRMAAEGYATQAARKVEHDRLAPFADVAAQLTARVRDEGREDVVVSAREFADKIEANGKIRVFGLALREQAIRGLLGGRLERKGALAYVVELRDRIAAEVGKGDKRDAALVHSDVAEIADVLRRECLRQPGEALKLRTRRGVGDVFAVVSKRYAPADAPEVVSQLAEEVPGDARGSWSYDPESTTWELRADVWTPTPVDQQAVGEAFRGYVSFRSRGNGTGRLNGGGGVELLRCLNASTYVAEGVGLERNHVGKILIDARAMRAKAMAAVSALCKAWGTAREEVLVDRGGEVLRPEYEALVGLPIGQQLKGFWFGELMNPRSELKGVLPGRTKDHVEGLVRAQLSERRDLDRVVRADFAQGWTRYIHGQPADVRRDAEAAIGSWVVNARPMTFDRDRALQG